MVGEEFWKQILADKVVLICESQNIHEAECEILIDTWLEDIAEEHRPTSASFLMESKRKLWNLEPTPF